MIDDNMDDAVLLRKQRRFLEQIERSIREVNRRIIHERIPEVDQEGFVRFASQVALLRARYLQAALEAGIAAPEGVETGGWPAVLRQHREAYLEAREAFEALQRAIERGYVDMGLAGAA